MTDDDCTPEQIVQDALDRHPGVRLGGCRPARLSTDEALSAAAFLESVAIATERDAAQA